MGAEAYALGTHVVFRRAPDLHTAAHEAAHVVQQRSGRVKLAGGVGRAGDPYEQHADAVADKVVAGESAEALLDIHGSDNGTGSLAVQRVQTETVKPDKNNPNNNFRITYGRGGDGRVDFLNPDTDVNNKIDAILACLLENDKGKWHNDDKCFHGYMVGVARCVDGSYIVANSGSDREEFKIAVKEVFGSEDPVASEIRIIVDSETGKEKRTVYNFNGKSSVIYMKEGQKNQGDCAGPKIINSAQGNDKETPVALVEKWFEPAGNGKPKSDESESRFGHGDTVAPCNKCEGLLGFMLQGSQSAAERGKKQVKSEKREERRLAWKTQNKQQQNNNACTPSNNDSSGTIDYEAKQPKETVITDAEKSVATEFTGKAESDSNRKKKSDGERKKRKNKNRKNKNKNKTNEVTTLGNVPLPGIIALIAAILLAVFVYVGS